MKRRLGWLISLLFVLATITVGCGRPVDTSAPTTSAPAPPTSGVPSIGYPKGLESPRWLTEDEKDKVIDIALNTPEALEEKEIYGNYRTALNWVGIVWQGNHASDLYGLDYESIGNVPENVPKAAEFYARVDIYFGEPERLLIEVAVNPDTRKVAHIENHPLKIIPE